MSLKRLFNKVVFLYQGGFSRSRKHLVCLLVILSAAVIFLPYFLKQRHNKVYPEVKHEHKDTKTVEKPTQSLQISGSRFMLNDKPFTILSGSIHYFRVLPAYWSDRLSKLKAMGLNTVETYIPWNLHEEVKGSMKFKETFDIVAFIKEAHKLGLYVIIRPGPYICAEWELGGLPSWLLHDQKQNLRSSYPPFLGAVEKYFDKLLPLLVPFEHSRGGPIIAWQIENEYYSYGRDMKYLRRLQEIMLKNDITELMIMSDNLHTLQRNGPQNLAGVLYTINLNVKEKSSLEELKKLQPNKPLMVTEFWPGWFDHWGDDHHVMSVDKAVKRVSNILNMGASINLYMFHGGTNFGFMNGAYIVGDEGYQPTITSYDYDAPLTEAGDITPKYRALREVLRKHAKNHSLPLKFPDIPENIKRTVYDPLHMNQFVPLSDTYKYVDQTVKSKTVLPMEELLINNNGGQSYGFILYRTRLPHGAKVLQIEQYRDRAQVMVGSQLVGTLDAFDTKKKYMKIEKMANVKLELKYKPVEEDEERNLDILVENMGRNNVGHHLNDQRKGILGEVFIDGKKPKSWTIYPLSFHPTFITRAFHEAKWETILSANQSVAYPGFFKGVFMIQSQPQDTYLLMKGWGKGVVFVNGHILGRYWKIGPQQTLYLPAPWLTAGENIIIILELEMGSKDGLLKFTADPILGKTVEQT